MRIGLIGTGRIGAFHAETLVGLPSVTSVVVHDANERQARAVADKLGAGYAADLAELLGSGLDGVVVAAPTAAHAELILAGVRAGIPVFCEKPVAGTLAETGAVLAELAHSDVPLHIGFQRRFDAGYQAVRDAVAAGRLGWLHTLRACTSDPLPPPAGYLPASGGIFRDCSVHDYDIIRWVTGREVTEVYATGANRGEDFFAAADDVDTGVTVLTLDDGTLATCTATRYNGAGYDVRLEACGSAGTLVAGLTDETPLTSAEGADWPAGGTAPGVHGPLPRRLRGRTVRVHRGGGRHPAQPLHRRRRAGRAGGRRGRRPLPPVRPPGARRGGDRVMRVAGAPISWGVCEVPGWGHQMPAGRVLDEMRQAGLSATEFGPDGFLPADPGERAELLAGHGLAAVGGFVPAVLHEPGHDPLPGVRRALAGFGTAGTLVLAAATGVDGYDARPELTGDGWRALLANLARIAAYAGDTGTTTVLHPHVGTMVERTAEVDRVLADSDIALCLDTGHLLVGGTDPAEVARRAPERVAHVHLKDVDADTARRVRAGELTYTAAVRDGMYRPLGQGDVDIAGIVGALAAVDYQGWYVMEQDTVLDAEPAPGKGPLADVTASLEYLARTVS